MASRTIRIGLIGYGVVGQGIVRLLSDNAATIEGRLGAPIEVRRVVARDPDKKREVEPPPGTLSFDPNDVLNDPDIDIVVEVVGGIEPAKSFVQRAIDSGKHVVTANKALLAEHSELIEVAESKGVDLYFEAAVAGGIPIIRLLREAFSSDRIIALRGIVNGTSNYILSRMTVAGLEFDEALREAQEKGFAEADPTLDVGGGDAAHKLTILTTLAYGARLTPDRIPTAGIENVTAIDIHFANRFGYVIKPLAVARALDDGKLDLRVHPALVRRGSVLASISGALNAVYVEGAMLGPCLTSGLGAGALPTAMSVVSDIVDVGRNLLVGAHGRVPSRAFQGDHLSDKEVQDPGDHRCHWYLRFNVRDRPGILARIAGVLGAADVSIEQMVQEGIGQDDGPVVVVMLTHTSAERNLMGALEEIATLDDVAEPPMALRIEED
ncbi:MAG: homoserine dehydrogenase [Deltaproteobacteria bacterium]|nr:homoserine dehydrogenase [Deltaproteobacteria bacterium]